MTEEKKEEMPEVMVTDGNTPPGYVTCLKPDCPHRLPREGRSGRHYPTRHHHKLPQEKK